MEAKEFIACILLILNSALFALYVFPSEESIRISGYILQMLGMSFAVVGLLRLRAHFDQPSLLTLCKRWVSGFPRWTNNTSITIGAAQIKFQGGRGRIESWSSDNPNAPIEERISSILRNLDRVRDELKSNHFTINRIVDELKQSNEDHQNALIALEDKVHNNLERLHTRDVLQALVGIVWMAVGITFSTLPNEIIRIIR